MRISRLLLLFNLVILPACGLPFRERATPVPQVATPSGAIVSTEPASPATEMRVLPTSVATPLPVPPEVERPMRDGLVNLAHLQHLTEIVHWDAEPVALVHIYSEAPDYGWVDAAGEGISAVDDVARAALVYLLYFQRTGDEQALELARYCLNFVMRLQAEDGEYYNFVYDREGTINRGGRTSYKSWVWWAARGQWALATGYRIFRQFDQEYALQLQQMYLRGEEALRQAIGPVGAYDELHGERIPAWLISGGSDVSALAILGLVEYYQAEPNTGTRQLITNLANGVAAYQIGGPSQFPFAAHPSSTSSTAMWHAWGSHQAHALALAGKLLSREDWIESARREAETFFVRLVATDLINEMNPVPRRGGQIAYGTQVITSGFLALYQATGEPQYARYAGLTAAWLFGNNMADVQMYDPETGRCYDGIEGPSSQRVNRNAGAESTIEALYTLLLVDQEPLAAEYLFFRPVEAPASILVEAESGDKIAGDATYGRREWTGEARFSNDRYYALRAGDSIAIPVKIPEPGEYIVYVSHLRRSSPRPERVVEAARTPDPVVIDGQLDEWARAQPLIVDRREQILRGAASWPGPEEAAFTVHFLWDEAFLYVAAQVQDREHVQNETGPSVWRGDVLWLYFDTRGDRNRVDIKLTLANTPQGPQVWNWTAQSFLPGAQLAWQPTENGYIYEAALPLESMNFLVPEERRRIHFDAGMGFTGGFINFTGLDPDTAGNLHPLHFVEELSPASFLAELPEQNPEDVAFSVQIGGQEPQLVPQAVSPDRDYLWLDPVYPGPVHLSEGEDHIVVTFAGRQADREAVVDAFLLLPANACKSFADEQGNTVVLCHDMLTARSSWEQN